jgi:FtsP/CotA-like multicopper oxidase with cupredoxin domain
VRKVVTATAMAVGICVAGTACQLPTKSASPAPTNAVTAPTANAVTTPTVAHIPSAPVDLNGSGESVQTANLEQGGYTVQYTDTSGYLIVEPVKRDGSTGASIINATEKSGVTTYASDGPVTLHIRNGGEWSLHFVPLS